MQVVLDLRNGSLLGFCCGGVAGISRPLPTLRHISMCHNVPGHPQMKTIVSNAILQKADGTECMAGLFEIRRCGRSRAWFITITENTVFKKEETSNALEVLSRY